MSIFFEGRRQHMLGLVLVVVVWVGLSFVFHNTLVVDRRNRFDFFAPWVAARASISGIDPYSETVSLRIQHEQGIVFEHPLGGGFVHPPHVVILFLPVALLPFPIFISVWLSSLFVASIVGLALGLQLLNVRPKLSSAAILVVCAVLFRYTMMGITFGQPTALCTAALVLCVWLYRSRGDWMVGPALAVALVKPDLTIGPTIFFLVLVFMNRRWKTVLSLVAITAVLTILTTVLLGPFWPMSYVRALRAYVDYHQSTWVLNDMPPIMWPFAAILLILASSQIISSIVKKQWDLFAGLVVCLSIIVVPQSGTYNLAVTVVPMVIGWARLRQVGRWCWLLALWSLPWAIWAMGLDPNADLRITPWIALAGFIALTFYVDGDRRIQVARRQETAVGSDSSPASEYR